MGLAFSAVRLCMAMAIFLSSADAETASRTPNRINELENAIGALKNSIAALNVITTQNTHRIDQVGDISRKILAYGVVDAHDPQLQKFLRPPLAGGLHSTADKIASRIQNMEMTQERPGIFVFSFLPKLNYRPVVLVTLLGAWGEIPVDRALVNVFDLSESGFKVRIIHDNNPINCAFSFFVLAGDGLK